MFPETLLHGLSETIARVPGVSEAQDMYDPGTRNLGWDIVKRRNLRQLAGLSVSGPLTLDSVEYSIASLPCRKHLILLQ